MTGPIIFESGGVSIRRLRYRIYERNAQEASIVSHTDQSGAIRSEIIRIWCQWPVYLPITDIWGRRSDSICPVRQ